MRRRAVFVFALGLWCLPALCTAQQGTAWRDSAQRLDIAIRALHDSLLQGDSTVTEVARRGDLVIAASANDKGIAIAALQRFGEVRDRWFGDAMPSSSGFRLVIHTRNDEPHAFYSDNQNVGAIVLVGLPDTGASVRTERSDWESGVPTGLIDRYGAMMIASVPALSAWIDNPPPLSMPEAERRDLAMYTLVTGMGPMQRKCVSGDMASCRFAMEIGPAPVGDTGAIFSKFMRADLLYFTLDAGGPGAWQRLQGAAAGGLEAGLTAAAKMSSDSLFAQWRSHLLLLRPTTAIITLRSALTAAAWSTLLLLGALGASRWA